MSRIIDADKIDLRVPYSVDGNGDIFVPLSAVKQAIAMTPTEDVERVVRCKDCKHATFYRCKNDAGYKGIICEYEIGTDDENFYCSYGERK